MFSLYISDFSLNVIFEKVNIMKLLNDKIVGKIVATNSIQQNFLLPLLN